RSRVMVDGRIQKTDRWVKDEEITVNRHPLQELSTVAFIAHKPAGYALTLGDPLKRPTCAELLPDPSLLARPIGPIDLPSSGLVLLTNRAELRGLAGPKPLVELPATFMVRLLDRPSSTQLALLASTAHGFDPLHVEDITDADEVEEETTVQLSPLPDELGALMGSSEARWERPSRPPAPAPQKQLPMLLVALRGTARALREALSFVGAVPREICCIRWGPLSLEAALTRPGGVRPLSQDELHSLLDASGKVAT
ncbi:unnamed protein product, partial [Effrenium voratum]